MILPDIVQLYDTSGQQKSEIRSGIGDYLRGTLFLYQYCKKKGMSLGVCFSGHPLSACMLSPLVLDRALISKRRLCVLEDDPSLLDLGGIFFSNKFPKFPLGPEEKYFVRTNCLTPLLNHEERVAAAMDRMGVKIKSYFVLHVRIGDRDGEAFSTEEKNGLLKTLENLALPKSYWSQTVLLTDSPMLRTLPPFDQFLSSNLMVGHAGVSGASTSSIIDSMAEFSLIEHSSGVFQMSSYAWGSGFSGMACSIFDVPLYQAVAINGFLAH